MLLVMECCTVRHFKLWQHCTTVCPICS